ncbi:MAG: ABC transporter permease [Candidatus Dormibacteria bacterium]
MIDSARIASASRPDVDVRGRPGAGRRALRAVATYLGTLLLLVSLNFLLPRLLPGDPLSALSDPSAPTYVQNDDTRASLSAYYGLDRPLSVQYVRYLDDLAHGSLGTSIRYNAPVSSVIGERLPWTLLLVGTALTVATVLGLLAGTHAGWRRGGRVDGGLLAFFVGIRTLPTFFLGSLAVFLFAVQLRWLPLGGAETAFAQPGNPLARAGDIAAHLVLPVSVLVAQFAGGQFLVMRAGMVSELGADYLLLGRVVGLRERRLERHHAARNALLPVVTVAALELGFAVTGSIFVETVFAYPGIGRLLFDSVTYRDYPTLQGCFLLLTLSVVTINLLADLLYSRLDPRVRR